MAEYSGGRTPWAAASDRARGLSALARWAARNGRRDEAADLTDKAAGHRAEADRLWAEMDDAQRQAALGAEAQRWAEWEAQRAERAARGEFCG